MLMVGNREGKGGGDRDVFNERPTREDQSTAVAPVEQKAELSTSCTIHTSQGDIVSTIFGMKEIKLADCWS